MSLFQSLCMDAQPRTRFAFFVHRSDQDAVITMDLGGNVCRARSMPHELLEAIGSLCRSFQEAGRRIVREHEADIPEFPGYAALCESSVAGACRATVGAHKLDGVIELVITLYDEGDDEAPVLILIDDQIDEFIRQALETN